MTGNRAAAPLTATRDWFRRDVEDKLRDAVGGAARLRVIVLLACALGLDSADRATVGSIAGPLEQALHIGHTEIGLLATVSIAVGAIATLPMGVLTDRIDRVRLLSVAIAVWSVAMVISGASGSYLMLLITRLALGAVAATAGPVVASLTGDFFPAAERGRIYGFILTGELVGTGIGFLVSGDVAAALSWRWSFWVLAVPGAVLSVVVWKLLPEPARGGQSQLQPGEAEIRGAEQGSPDGDGAGAGGQEESRASRPGSVDRDRDDDPGGADVEGNEDGDGLVAREVRQQGIRPHEDLVLHTDPSDTSLWWAVRYVVSVRTNLLLIIASGFGYFFFAGLQTFAVILLRDHFSIGQGAASTLLVVLGAGAIVGVLITGRLADRMIDRHHLTARPVIAGISFLVAVAFFVPGLLTGSLLIAAPLFFIAAAGVGGANAPLDAARLDLMHSRLWGRAEAVRTVLRSTFQAIAPLLFGIVSTRLGTAATGLGTSTGSLGQSGSGLDHTFLIMLAPLVVAALLLLLRARRTYPRDVATALASEEATRAGPDT